MRGKFERDQTMVLVLRQSSSWLFLKWMNFLKGISNGTLICFCQISTLYLKLLRFFKLSDLSITEEIWFVRMCIWFNKYGTIGVLRIYVAITTKPIHDKAYNLIICLFHLVDVQGWVLITVCHYKDLVLIDFSQVSSQVEVL